MNNALATRRTTRSAPAKLRLVLVFVILAMVLHAPASMADPADMVGPEDSAGPEDMVGPEDIPGLADIPGPADMAGLTTCVSTSVASEAELNAAIAAFNAETRRCRHVITLTADIFLTVPTRPIINTRNQGLLGAWLVIDGDGFTIHGADEIRPFTILAHTNVAMKQITVTGGGGEGGLSDFWGGGIFNDGNLYITDSKITGNSGKDGGGIYNGNRATMNIANSTVTDNDTFDYGGGICNNGAMTVSRSVVSLNHGYDGGGIANNCILVLADSAVSGNSGEYGGGIYSDARLTVVNSTISGNDAGIWGGGISNGNDGIYGGTIILTNSTISCNSAEQGGGIYNDGPATLINCTVADNLVRASDHRTGGIENCEHMVLKNSIIGNNGQADCMGFGVQAFSSLIGDSGEDACHLTDGENGNIIGVDPRLGPLAYYGGSTMTHLLMSDSPAIDKGDNDLALDPNGNPLKTDQRGPGYARIRGNSVDIGALEVFYLRSRPSNP